jgi:hypothetical protein
MRRSDILAVQGRGRGPRTTQIVFGERQHLLRVLESLEKSAMPRTRMEQEGRIIERLIHERTEELNQINPAWDEKVSTALRAEIEPKALDRLYRETPKEDYYLLRLISEHPRASSVTLRRLARHPYPAIRENIARHPNADRRTLAYLSEDRTQPLWYLVAFNPNAPDSLRKKLQQRMHTLANKSATQ